MQVSKTVVTAFTPITVTFQSAVEVANVLGALVGYGTAYKFAENNLKAIGLGEFYSGNVRKAARTIALDLAKAAGADTAAMEDIFQSYRDSDRYSESRPSKAGSAVVGTDADLAPGSEETHFEDEEGDGYGNEVEPASDQF